MSRYFSAKYDKLEPYVPGEQPQNAEYIKLNTNESPFPASPNAQKMVKDSLSGIKLYSDPDCTRLREKLRERYDWLEVDNFVIGNGSDEILNFAFMAFCDENIKAVFPDITYGFYPVFSDVNRVPYHEIPVDVNLKIRPAEYIGAGGTVFIPNPNAHTGIALGIKEIEEILAGNPDNVVVIDEAYVDFGTESALRLVNKYDNLLVIQTFSKSRSLAGARLGFGAGNRDIIRDLNTVRNSINPYNVNSMTMAAGIGALQDEEYTKENCKEIIRTREFTASRLREMGFEMTNSSSNFLLIKHPEIDGGWMYEELKRRGILIRHFTKERISQYNRVTIGSKDQMEIFLKEVGKVVISRTRGERT